MSWSRGGSGPIWKFTTVDQLKQAIVEECNKLSQRFIDRSIDEWRCRFILVVQQQGGHTGIEHITLWISSSECWNCSNSVNIWCMGVTFWRTLYTYIWNLSLVGCQLCNGLDPETRRHKGWQRGWGSWQGATSPAPSDRRLGGEL